MTLRALFPVTQQFQNKNGSNLVGGKVYIYYQGRTALATTYHDEEGTVVNANPVLLDNNGRATVFVNTIYSYTIVVCDYYGKELFSQDITLHDSISDAKDVLVTGSDGTVKVGTTTLPNGVQYDLSVNTDIIATKTSVDSLSGYVNTLTDNVNSNTANIESVTELANTNAEQISLIKQSLNADKWVSLNCVPYNSNIELTIMNAGYRNGFLNINGSVQTKNGTTFVTNTVNYIFSVEGVTLLLDFRNYYGTCAYNSNTNLYPCAMAALKNTNTFYIYPTQTCNIFYFNATVPVELVS